MKTIYLYSDGACRNNGRENSIGGYAFVLLDMENKRKKEVNFACRNTTNNIMELKGVIEGLKCLKSQCNIKIFTDSKYVVNGFNKGWINSWQKNGWVTSSKQPVKNKELWQELLSLTKKHNCEFNWVKGHNNNKWNERCDELANIAMDNIDN